MSGGKGEKSPERPWFHDREHEDAAMAAITERHHLRPCPFCGKRPAYDHTKIIGVRFSCLECEEVVFDDFDAAANFWNTRAE